MSNTPPSIPASSRPAKFRTACNSCHAAKVRCSGERTGCIRCKTLDVSCKYEISMVGRVPGRRDKNKRKFSPKALQDRPEESEPPTAISSSPATSTSAAPLGSEADVQFDPSVEPDFVVEGGDGDWITDLERPSFENLDQVHLDPAFGGLLDTSVWLSHQQPLGDLMSQDGTTMDLFPTSTMPKPSHPRAPALAFADGTLLNSRSHSVVENKCLRAYGEIIQFLEIKATDRLNGLDEVVRICRTCTSRLATWLDTTDYQQSFSCTVLCCLALNLIICLLESCIVVDELQIAGSSPPPFGGIRYGCALPRLSFGSLQVDAEEQLALAHIILRKEANSCLRLLDQLRSQTHRVSDNRASQCLGQARERFCIDFERRLKEIIANKDT